MRQAVPSLLVLLATLAWPISAHAQPWPSVSPSSPAPPSSVSPAPPPPLPPGGPSPWQSPAPSVSPYDPNGAPPVPPPYGTEWGAPNAAPAAPRRVYVELHVDDPRTRIDRVGEGLAAPVCFAPCRKWLDAQGTYVITGEGVRSTSRFALPDDRNAVTLDVRAGSTTRVIGGALLIGAGVVTAYIGVLVWEAGALGNLDQGTQHSTQISRVGMTLVAIGVPAALIGVYLAVTSHTSVSSSTGSTFTQDTPSRRARPRVALTARGLEF